MKTFATLLGLSLVIGASPCLAAEAAEGHVTMVENLPPPAGWAIETDASNPLMRSGCLEALTRIAFDGSLKPSLATSWTPVSPTVWEFKLRNGVRFQNGQTLDAAAVAESLNHALHVPVPSRSFSPKLIQSVEAVGSDTVRITTTDPSVILPIRMASPNTGILAPSAFQAGSVNLVGTCTGPFAITDLSPLSLELKRNDSYWGERPHLAGATIRFLPDGSVRVAQVRTGEAQIARNIPPTSIATIRSLANVHVDQIPVARTTALYLNNKQGPLANETVRRAIQAALDTDGIAEAIYEGTARPAIGPFAPDEPWAPKAKPVGFDAARAAALLKDAGVKPETLHFTILTYTERSELKDVAAVVQDELKQIGIDAQIRVANYSAIEPDLLAGRYNMALVSRSHLSDVADPISFLQADYACGGAYNLSQFCDPAFDAELKRAGATADVTARNTIYANVAQQIQSRAVDVFLVHEQAMDAISTKLKHYRVHPQGHYALTPQLSLD